MQRKRTLECAQPSHLADRLRRCNGNAHWVTHFRRFSKEKAAPKRRIDEETVGHCG
jgi:hypothetical protein